MVIFVIMASLLRAARMGTSVLVVLVLVLTEMLFFSVRYPILRLGAVAAARSG
jgi:hypothetical protein